MPENAFQFGKNWQEYVKHYLSEERIKHAENSLVNFLRGCDIKGKSFLDIGCGSGLFSLAAYRIGARRVVSFDVDPFSVQCCRNLKEKEGNPDCWQVMEGSILDKKFTAPLGRFDVVYSWGVLHHTGKMWEALANAGEMVKEKGCLYIAIYNKVEGLAFFPDGRFGSSKFWSVEKRIYSRLPSFFQSLIDLGVMTVLILLYLITFKNPFKIIKNHTSTFRGMSWRIDIKDWLGGYPYEYASVDEIFLFFKDLGFSLENLKTHTGLMNNEYLFKKA